MTKLTQAEIELIFEVVADRKGRYEDDKHRCEMSNQTGSDYHKRQAKMINVWAAIETKLSAVIQPEPSEPELTAEMAEVLKIMVSVSKSSTVVFELPEDWPRLARLKDSGYVINSGVMPGVERNGDWHITDTGRAALKAHQASVEGSS